MERKLSFTEEFSVQIILESFIAGMTKKTKIKTLIILLLMNIVQENANILVTNF